MRRRRYAPPVQNVSGDARGRARLFCCACCSVCLPGPGRCHVRAAGVPLMDAPPARYYEMLAERLPGFDDVLEPDLSQARRVALLRAQLPHSQQVRVSSVRLALLPASAEGGRGRSCVQ